MTFDEFLAQRGAAAGATLPYNQAAAQRYAYQAPAAQPTYNWEPLVYTPFGEKPGMPNMGLLDDILKNEYTSGAYNIGATSGNATAPGGQSLGADMTAAASKAAALAGNPLFATSPVAQLAGLLGRSYMDSRLNGLGEAAGKLGAAQGLSGLGINTVSDAFGNVRTYSSPESIAAADRATFGSTGGGGDRGFGGSSGYGSGGSSGYGNGFGGGIGSSSGFGSSGYGGYGGSF
jgi:hypothetical protein